MKGSMSEILIGLHYCYKYSIYGKYINIYIYQLYTYIYILNIKNIQNIIYICNKKTYIYIIYKYNLHNIWDHDINWFSTLPTN